MTTQSEHTPAPEWYRWILWFSAALLLFMPQISTVRNTDGDPRLTLLSSQALLETGSLEIESYLQDKRQDQWLQRSWVVRYDGQRYNYFPPGPSLAALPFVAVARMMGKDMLYRDEDIALQLLLAGLSLALLFLLLVKLAREFLPPVMSLFLSLGFVMGTMLISTGATGFWSHHLLLICEAWILLLLVRQYQGTARAPGWQMLLACFLIYAARPAGLIFVLLSFACIFFFLRQDRIRLILWGAGGILLFFAFNWITLGQFQPEYYITSDRWRTLSYFHGLYHLWLGASRGYWVYSPFLLVILYGLLVRQVRANPFYLLGLAWFLALSLILPRFFEWPGGWSFGPRLLIDTLPGMFLALVLVVQARREGPLPLRLYRPAVSAFSFLLLISVWIHVRQGLLNPHTMDWHSAMMLSNGNEDGWGDWSNPQFLCTEESNARAHKRILYRQAITDLDREAPEGAAIFLPNPDPEEAWALAQWQKTQGARHPIYTTLKELKAAGVKTCYTPVSSQDALKDAQVQHYFAVPDNRSLGECVQQIPPGHTLLLSVKDEATANLSPRSREILTAMGSQVNTLGYRGSWAAVLQKDKIVAEQISNDSVARATWKNWYLTSAGNPFGNYAIIVRKGFDFSLNKRGINLVLVDPEDHVIYSFNVDSHQMDAVAPRMLRVDF